VRRNIIKRLNIHFLSLPNFLGAPNLGLNPLFVLLSFENGFLKFPNLLLDPLSENLLLSLLNPLSFEKDDPLSLEKKDPLSLEKEDPLFFVKDDLSLEKDDPLSLEKVELNYFLGASFAGTSPLSNFYLSYANYLLNLPLPILSDSPFLALG
jgi:hypothetical protein